MSNDRVERFIAVFCRQAQQFALGMVDESFLKSNVILSGSNFEKILFQNSMADSSRTKLEKTNTYRASRHLSPLRFTKMISLKMAPIIIAIAAVSLRKTGLKTCHLLARPSEQILIIQDPHCKHEPHPPAQINGSPI